MVSLRCQTVLDATQFSGAAGVGLWDFSDFDDIPRTTRVVLLSISYFEPDADEDLTVEIWAQRPNGLPTERMPIAFGLANGGNLISPITGAGELRACGITVPRDLPGTLTGPTPPGVTPDAQWSVHLMTTGKVLTATACCDWMLCPYPDTDARDSRDK